MSHYPLDLTPRALRVGADLASLLLYSKEWISRRVETVSFTSDGLTRRSVSLEINLFGDWEDLRYMNTVPEFMTGTDYPQNQSGAGLRLGRSDSLLLPLTLMKKEPLSLLDVSTQGLSISVSHTDDNAILSLSALVALSGALLECGLTDFDDGLLEELSLIVHDPYSRNKDLRSIFDGWTEGQRARLMAEPQFLKLASDLFENFVLYGEVPQSRQTHNQIVKFTYTLEPSQPERRLVREWFFAPHERLFEFDLNTAGDAYSFHFQLNPPTGVHVSGCEGDGTYGEFAQGTELDGLTPRKTYQLGRNNPENSFSNVTVVGGIAHIQMRNWRQGTRATGLIYLCPSNYVIAPLVLTSGLIFAIATLLLAASFSMSDPFNGSDSSWLGLLVALPGLAAAFIANHGEHGLQSRLLSSPRKMLATDVFLLIMVGLTLGLGVSSQVLHWLSLGFFIVSCFIFWRFCAIYSLTYRTSFFN